MEPVKAIFREPARLKAAIAYYRALPGLIVNLPQLKIAFSALTVPARMIYGSEDAGNASYEARVAWAMRWPRPSVPNWRAWASCPDPASRSRWRVSSRPP